MEDYPRVQPQVCPVRQVYLLEACPTQRLASESKHTLLLPNYIDQPWEVSLLAVHRRLRCLVFDCIQISRLDRCYSFSSYCAISSYCSSNRYCGHSWSFSCIQAVRIAHSFPLATQVPWLPALSHLTASSSCGRSLCALHLPLLQPLPNMKATYTCESCIRKATNLAMFQARNLTMT